MSKSPVVEKKENGCFSITYTIQDFFGFTHGYRYSPIERHFDMDWNLSVCVEKDKWKLWLTRTMINGGDQRRIFVEASLFYLSPSESKVFPNQRAELTKHFTNMIVNSGIHVKYTSANHMIDGNVKVRCDVRLSYKFPHPKLNFATPSHEIISDVVLLVEGKEFKVSKVMLASFSTYFRTMFFEKFREAKDPIIPLEEVDADEFQELLDVIYHKADVNLSNARELLHLVTYFGMKNIQDKCEQALLAAPDSTVPLNKKLLLADKYVLPKLLEKCTKSFTTISQLKAATPKNVNLLNASSIERLLQRVMDLPN